MNPEGLAGTPYNIRTDAFRGTARDYLHYRLPYPTELIEDLRERTRPSGRGRLLDLGSGPGRVAFALATYFREVLAVDIEPEMVEAGQEEAVKLGVSNVTWQVGRAEDLEAPPASFEMVAIGEAFHRFDQPVVLKKVRSWLAPGGFLVLLGSGSAWQGSAEWQRLLNDVIERWKPPGAAAGHPSARPTGERPGRVLADAGFIDMGDREFKVSHVWSVASLIGNLHSTSVLSRHALGANARGFETDLRRTLLARYPENRFVQTVGFGYTLAQCAVA